ncbi:sensor histidine kinase [Clostridium paridis]|uniref:histidine kinase n=1 Tax=Clostridium paridis TaxID=2803863 RepID=A0A937K3C2_9CLOT|nr:sensor histidine kinase [Clostridium paridis]MBL4931497.1 sensor histidine kinase [Clostridium paridis]
MKKKIITNFIKDSLRYIIAFYLSIGVIILYYYITADIKDIIYPIVIASTIFLIFIFIEFVKYYNFNINIKDLINLQRDKLLEETNQQKYFMHVLKDMQGEYLKEISRTNAENNSYKYFVSQWIHNMKTPVSIISLVLQKIKVENMNTERNLSQEEISSFIQEIVEENTKLQNGLEQLLNILRMEQFAKDYEPEAVNLVDSIKELINSKKSLFIYNNVFPQIECEDDNITVLTDEKWNKFMIEQIINNAVKYSSERDVKKYIKFNIMNKHGEVKLNIIDEGIGIPEIDINRLFEPFFTGANGRKYKEATGIGLYICEQLAKNLKHKIHIESKQGRGTKVTITYFLNSQ